MLNIIMGFFIALSAVTMGYAQSPLKVVTTTGHIADIVKFVGGDYVSVQALMGPGVDPHLYKASESDVEKISHADIIFYNGLHLEAKMTSILEQLSKRRTIVAISKDMPADQFLADEKFPDVHDPHIWFDVMLWSNAVHVVRDELIKLRPLHQEIFRSNAQQYIQQLQVLHEHVIVRSQELIPEQRILVTAHDAFRYFARAYDFKVYGLQGISTETEAGVKDVSKLADYIVKNKVKAIFVETSVSERTIQAVVEAVAAKGWQVRIGGELYSDALGTLGTKEGTYVGVIEHNINTIVNALK